MNTSLQAACGRHLAPAVPEYPFRALIWEVHGDEWKLAEVFEMSTLELAEMTALELCTEPYEPGVTAMHYVVGEVARDDDDPFDEEPDDGCTDPGGHEWAYTGTQYGGDDPSFHGEGRCYCIHCGADGDA